MSARIREVPVRQPAIRLRTGVKIKDRAAGRVVLASNATDVEIALDGLSVPLRDGIRKLAQGRATLDEIAAQLLKTGGPGELPRFHYIVHRLAAGLMLGYTLRCGDREILRVDPADPTFAFDPRPVATTSRYRLSRFAFARRADAGLVVERPWAGAQVLLLDPDAAALVARLAEAKSLRDLCAESRGKEPFIAHTLSYLAAAGIFGQADRAGNLPEDLDEALRLWEPHDYLFHFRTRTGRHDSPIGAMYRFGEEIAPLPALKPAMSNDELTLRRVDVEDIAKRDLSFAAILEARRSVRDYDKQPLSIAQLGEFLFRTARVRGTAEIDPERGIFYEQTSRPYPNGGAAYELELYLTVKTCEGLAPGVYHYNAARHCLSRLRGEDAIQPLLDDARIATANVVTPQVLITITSRLGRLSWKYSGMAYATTLKNVGALYQTMYLVATAMGLAPCALGSGNSLHASQAFGIDPAVECAVGEFLLGSAPH
jgi:SagB-type dehydrogenase family enzyme